MIQFKEINGQLCLMLEKPIPLTEKAQFPCVVRLIQDDSQMGKYNKRLADGGRLPFVCNGIKENHIQKDGKSPYFEYAYECYETIGYPVADHSEEWALYRMMQGDVVFDTSTKLAYKLNNNMIAYKDFQNRWQDTYEGKTHENWIAHQNKKYPKHVWQIYTESKPLLADAKVGDLCQRSNGRYTQFHSKHKLNDGTIAYYFDDVSGSTNIDGDHCSHECGNNIVSCEPLAAKGSAEWAWQMAKLGIETKCSRGKIRISKSGMIEVCYNGMAYAMPMTQSPENRQYVINKMRECSPDGWQLYEPKPCAVCKGTGKVYSCTKKSGKVEDEAGSYALSFTYDAVDCPACKEKEIDKPKSRPEHPAINGYNRYDYVPVEGIKQPKSTPHAVQVGDWVRTAKGDGKVIEIPLTSPEVMLSNGQRGSFHADEISVISPAEVVVTIGCLSGTVRSRDNKSFHLLRKGKNTMVIYFDALDTPTRKLVRELIEKQEGDEK